MLESHLPDLAKQGPEVKTNGVGPLDIYHLARFWALDYGEGMEAAFKHLTESSIFQHQRHLGQVCYAAEHDADTTGFWSDWAIVALPEDDEDTGILRSHKSPFIESNVVFVKDVHYTVQGLVSGLAEFTMPAAWQTYGKDDFVRLKQPAESTADIGNDKPRVVFKQGARTRLTAGLMSPMDAVIRMSVGGRSVVASTTPVFGLRRPGMGMGQFPFSRGGDSGSCVFDSEGVVLGLVHSGIGKDATEGGHLYTEGYDDRFTWLFDSVSFVTPIRSVLGSIEKVVGRKPHIV